MATIGNTNISISLVKTTIGEASNDVGTLCMSGNINKWSLKKPYSITPPGVSYCLEGSVLKEHGLYRSQGDLAIFYNAPQGGSAGPFRLGDFRGYNHVAAPPSTIIITGVYDISYDAQIPGPPYLLYAGFDYRITFSVMMGPIDPETICASTKWQKIIGEGETDYGVGGIGAGPANILNDQSIAAVDVHSGGETGLTFDFFASANPPFDFYYCYRNSALAYFISKFRIEDDAYRSLISVIAFNIYFSDIIIRKLPDLNGYSNFFADGTVYNDAAVGITSARVRYMYRTNSKAYHYAYSDIVTLTASGSYDFYDQLPFNDLDVGQNIIELYAQTERRDASNVWHEVGSAKYSTATFTLLTGDIEP